MIRRPPRSTRTDTLFPYTTLFRSSVSPTAGLISENFADVENITTGFFAQGYYELTDTIRATGGIRYTWDRRNTVLHNVRAYGLPGTATVGGLDNRSEEHTSELQSLMRISYAVFCLKKKTKQHNTHHTISIRSIIDQ